MARGHLVTNHHVFVGPNNAVVTLGWQRDDTPASRRETSRSWTFLSFVQTVCLISSCNRRRGRELVIPFSS